MERRKGGLIRRQQCFMTSARQLMGEKRLVAGAVGLNLIKFAFWYSIPYLIFLGQGEITLPQTMAVTSLSVMLAAVIPSPAGIGSTEFVFTALFSGIRNRTGRLRVASVPLRYLRIPVSGGGGCGHHTPHLP